MLFQQAIALAPLEAMLVAAAGMSLGLLSYYLAGATTARHRVGTATSTDAIDDGTKASKHADDAATEGAPTTDASTQGAVFTWLSSHRLTRRFLDSLEKAQAQARPVIERRGMSGVFWLCVAPSALATAGAFVSGSIGFGFSRFLLAAFSSKLALAAIVTLAALVFANL